MSGDKGAEHVAHVAPGEIVGFDTAGGDGRQTGLDGDDFGLDDHGGIDFAKRHEDE